MSSHKRKRRAAVEDLYRNCIAGGDCPEDVRNKVEQNTIADRILKWLTPFLYLGGLGIGTGRGTGGRFGYRPISTGESAAPGGRPGSAVIRPGIPAVETITPDLFPVDAVDANTSSVVPMVDAESDLNIVNVLEEAQPGPVQPPETNEPPTIDVTPTSKTRVKVTQSTHTNPTFHLETVGTESSHDSSAVVFMGANSTVIGPETSSISIELSTFARTGESSGEQFNLTEETGFSTSTPTGEPAPSRPRLNSRWFYQQVRVDNPAFLTRPDTLIAYDNPVYDPEVTATFEQDVRDVTFAPDPDFQDVVKLSRPYYSQTETGNVRVSRLGTRGTLHTRSGLRIGPTAHFYQDVSSINPGQSIELQVIGEAAGGGVVYDGLASEEFELINLDDLQESYADEDLIDHIEEVGENLHLVIRGGGRKRPPISVPQFSNEILENVGGITISFPTGDKTETLPPHVVDPSAADADIIISFTDDSYNTVYDPSLFKLKKRKRRFH